MKTELMAAKNQLCHQIHFKNRKKEFCNNIHNVTVFSVFNKYIATLCHYSTNTINTSLKVNKSNSSRLTISHKGSFTPFWCIILQHGSGLDNNFLDSGL